MKFMATFKFKADIESRDLAISRFKETGGMPPNGVKMLGRWTAADLSGGFDLLESDDAGAITEFALMWSDLLETHVIPVVDDAELTAVLSRTHR